MTNVKSKSKGKSKSRGGRTVVLYGRCTPEVLKKATARAHKALGSKPLAAEVVRLAVINYANGGAR